MKNNVYYREEAKSLQRQIEDSRFFLSHHKPSLGFWGECLLRGFLRANLPGKVKVGQGFVLLDEKTKSTIQNLYNLIHEKVEGIERIFSDVISPQCDIIVYKGEPLKTFGEVIIVNSKDVIAVIEVKCSIGRNQFKTTIDNFKKLNNIGVKNKYLFIYNSCSLKSIYSYFYPKRAKDGVFIAVDFEPLYDHGDEACLPKAIVGVDKKYCLCQDYVISDRDQLGYVSYKLKDDTEELSCLQLFLSHLFCDIDYSVNGGEEFKMNFDSMLYEFSFGLYDL